jgi:regulator of protease activity HflC (stomatin/prohibitin superfamily)
MEVRTILIVGGLVLTGFVGGCFSIASCNPIKPGNVGVSIQKCNGGGVKPAPIPPGYYWKSVFCEDVEEYPTSLQTIILTKAPHEGSKEDESITVTSSEGLPISMDVSLSFTLDSAMVPHIYTKYRAPIEKISHTFIRQTIREGLQGTIAKYTAEHIYSDKKESARAEVQEFLTEKLKEEGFLVTQFTFNEIRVPDQVTAAINSKVAMTQDAMKAEQEVRKTEAEAKQLKARAEGEANATRLRADAEAYSNKTISESLTPQYIHYKSVDKWDGKLPQFSGGSAPMPFIELDKK